MQATLLIPIALVLFTQISLGFTEEVAAAGSTNEAAGEGNKASLNRVTRGAYDFMRLARGLHMLRLGKRDGASAEGADKLEPTEPFVPEMPLEDEEEPYIAYPDEDGYVYSELDDIMPLEEGGDEEEKRSLGMLRLGKRQLSMLRLGKRQDEDLNESFNEEDKRSLGMLRLGKRQIGMLRLGKRPMSMLRLGKRPMSMLRLGKRPMSMLRLGKRPMSMLRLGKRPMSMLRLGKRPMSMLRLGKREDEDQEDKRSLNMLRLGKRSSE